MKDGQGRSGDCDRSTRGLWIAFFGPDGVGKSAVIDGLRQELDGAFNSCLRFHFRPRFGRRALERAPITDPHTQTPRGTLISIGKLVYWWLDCWLGYCFVLLPALRRSGLVISDRYLPDLLVDPVRYRLPASVMKFAARLVKLAPRPGLCVLLDAPSETVQQRKQEVCLAESQRQRSAYLKAFEALPSGLVVDADCPVGKITPHLAAAILGVSQKYPLRSRLSHCRLPT